MWSEEQALNFPGLVKPAKLRESLKGPVKFRLWYVAHNNAAVLRDGLDRFSGQLDEVTMFSDEERRSTWLESYGTGRREVVKRFPFVVVCLDKILNSTQYFVLVLRLQVNFKAVDQSSRKNDLQCSCVSGT